MIQTSDKYMELIQSNNRSFIFSMLVNNTDNISDNDLFNSLQITYEGANNNKLGIGQFCKSSCTFYVSTETNIDWKNAYFTLTIQVENTTDIIPLGKFWVNEVKYNATMQKYNIVAYDVPNEVSLYPDLHNYLVPDVIEEFESITGMNIINKNLFSLESIKKPEEKETWQDLIGYIAGYDGYNIRTDRHGNLEAYKFAGDSSMIIKVSNSTIVGNHLVGEFVSDYEELNNSIIDASNIFENGLNTSDLVIINSFKVDNGTKVLTIGEGYGVDYKNPYITSLNNILDYMGKTYTPMEISFRGNPAIEIGDIIYIKDNKGNIYTCYVMKSIINYDGGLSGKIYSFATDTLEKVIPISPTDKKIEETKEAINSIMDGLMGGSGYFSFIDENGKVISAVDIKKGITPVGWQITDSETITNTTKGWRFLLGGLNHSSNGFKTFDTFALDSNGNINASAIKTGILNAIDITGSTITFNKGDGQVVAKGTEWDGGYKGVRFYGEGDFGIESKSIGIKATSKNNTGIQVRNRGLNITLMNNNDDGDIVNYILLQNNNDGNIDIRSGDKAIQFNSDGIILFNGYGNNRAYLQLTNDGKIKIRSNGVEKIL